MIRKGLATASVAAFACAFLASPSAAQTVGSASVVSKRNCNAALPTTACVFNQPALVFQYGGGLGLGGANGYNDGQGNRAWTNVTLGQFDLPQISAFAASSGPFRMNANAIAFQSYFNNGPDSVAFSISGGLHIVNNNGVPGLSPFEDPGEAIYTSYLGIWNPSLVTGATAQTLINQLFYAPCGTGGVLATANSFGSLTPGEHTFNMTTSACGGAGSITLAPGQEVLVVAGVQIPVNRGAYIDASRTFSTRLGDDLSAEQKTQIVASLQSSVQRGADFRVLAAVPEPSTWAMLIIGFAAVGGFMRRRRPSLRFA